METDTAGRDQVAKKEQETMHKMVNASYISSDLEIEGDVQSTGTVLVCGRVRGTILAHTLSIDDGGSIDGTAHAQVAVIGGTLEGRLTCSALKLSEFGKVIGDVSYSHLEVVAGGSLVGQLSVATTVA